MVAEQTIENVAEQEVKEATEKTIENAVTKSKPANKLHDASNGSAPKKFTEKPPGACFVAGTKILTKNGFKIIEDIQAGDSVWAFLDSLHIEKLQKVISGFIRTTNRLYYIAVDKELIICSKEHPFYVLGNG